MRLSIKIGLGLVVVGGLVTLIVLLTKPKKKSDPKPDEPDEPDESEEEIEEPEDTLETCVMEYSECDGNVRKAQYTINPDTGKSHDPGITCDPSNTIVLNDEPCFLVDMIPDTAHEWWYGGHLKLDDESEAGIFLQFPPQASPLDGRRVTMRFVRYLSKKEITDK